MNVKTAALFALIGMLLLSILCLVVFVNNLMAMSQGVVALNVVLSSLIHLLADVAVTIFFFAYYQSK